MDSDQFNEVQGHVMRLVASNSHASGSKSVTSTGDSSSQNAKLTDATFKEQSNQEIETSVVLETTAGTETTKNTLTASCQTH